MTPITHFVYVAVAVFMFGLFGVLRGRSSRVTLTSIQLMVGACVLIAVSYARWWGNHDGQVLGLVAILVGAALYFVGLLIRRSVAGAPWENPKS